jgi:hypothetical protein
LVTINTKPVEATPGTPQSENAFAFGFPQVTTPSSLLTKEPLAVAVRPQQEVSLLRVKFELCSILLELRSVTLTRELSDWKDANFFQN